MKNFLSDPNTIYRRIFLIVVASLVVYLSHQPSLKPPVEYFIYQDKLFHMIEFGGLGLALLLNRRLFGTRHQQFRMISAGILWGFLDEAHQSFIPGRDSSFSDVLADTAGILVAVLLLYRFFSKNKNMECIDG